MDRTSNNRTHLSFVRYSSHTRSHHTCWNWCIDYNTFRTVSLKQVPQSFQSTRATQSQHSIPHERHLRTCSAHNSVRLAWCSSLAMQWHAFCFAWSGHQYNRHISPCLPTHCLTHVGQTDFSHSKHTNQSPNVFNCLHETQFTLFKFVYLLTFDSVFSSRVQSLHIQSLELTMHSFVRYILHNWLYHTCCNSYIGCNTLHTQVQNTCHNQPSRHAHPNHNKWHRTNSRFEHEEYIAHDVWNDSIYHLHNDLRCVSHERDTNEFRMALLLRRCRFPHNLDRPVYRIQQLNWSFVIFLHAMQFIFSQFILDAYFIYSLEYHTCHTPKRCHHLIFSVRYILHTLSRHIRNSHIRFDMLYNKFYDIVNIHPSRLQHEYRNKQRHKNRILQRESYTIQRCICLVRVDKYWWLQNIDQQYAPREYNTSAFCTSFRHISTHSRDKSVFHTRCISIHSTHYRMYHCNQNKSFYILADA